MRINESGDWYTYLNGYEKAIHCINIETYSWKLLKDQESFKRQKKTKYNTNHLYKQTYLSYIYF